MGLLEKLAASVKVTIREPSPENKKESHRLAMKRSYEQHATINNLRTLAYKVVEDGVITLSEALELKRAFREDEMLRNDEAFRPVYLIVRKITKKTNPEELEQDKLIDALHRIIDPTWCTDGEIIDEIKGKTFCLTGDFLFGSRKQVQDHLVSLGGISKSNVSRNLDYLIIGTEGSEEYAYGNYGSKVKKAMELQNTGCAIKIVPEREFGPLR